MLSGADTQSFLKYAEKDDLDRLVPLIDKMKDFRSHVTPNTKNMTKNKAAISGCEQGNSGTYLSGLAAMIRATLNDFVCADVVVSDTQECPNISRELEAQHQFEGDFQFASPSSAQVLIDQECDRRSLAWIAINRFALASGLTKLSYKEVIRRAINRELQPEPLQAWLNLFDAFPVSWSVDPEDQMDQYKTTPQIFLTPFKTLLATWDPSQVQSFLLNVVNEFNALHKKQKLHLKLFRTLEELHEQEHHVRMLTVATSRKKWKEHDVEGFYNSVVDLLVGLMIGIDCTLAENGKIRTEDIKFIIKLLNNDPDTLRAFERTTNAIEDPNKQLNYRTFRSRVVTLMECVPVFMQSERKSTHRALNLIIEPGLFKDGTRIREHFIDTILAYPLNHSRAIRAFCDSRTNQTGRTIISEILKIYAQYLLNNDDIGVLQQAGGNLAQLRQLPPSNRRVVLPLEKLRSDAYDSMKQVFSQYGVSPLEPSDFSLLLNSLLHTIREYPVVFSVAAREHYDCVVYPGHHAPVVEARRLFNGDTDYGDAAEAGIFTNETDGKSKPGKRGKNSPTEPPYTFLDKKQATGGKLDRSLDEETSEDTIRKLIDKLQKQPGAVERLKATIEQSEHQEIVTSSTLM